MLTRWASVTGDMQGEEGYSKYWNMKRNKVYHGVDSSANLQNTTTKTKMYLIKYGYG